MKVVSAWGVRGGVGTTSMVALLGESLHAIGESVLLVDLNPADMLRLHFSVPFTDRNGWATTDSDEWNGHEQAYLVDERLWLIPHGRKAAQEETTKRVGAEAPDEYWSRMLDRLSSSFSWVLFDLPVAGSGFTGVRARSDLDLLVTTADAGCHVLLAQAQLAPATRFLVNLFNPSRQLCRDLLLDWRHRYSERLLPVLLHQDEAVHEALALKTNAHIRFPDSAAASDARALATWCMARRGTRP